MVATKSGDLFDGALILRWQFPDFRLAWSIPDAHAPGEHLAVGGENQGPYVGDAPRYGGNLFTDIRIPDRHGAGGIPGGHSRPVRGIGDRKDMAGLARKGGQLLAS